MQTKNSVARRSWTKPEIIDIASASNAQNGAASNTIDHFNPISTQFDPGYTGPTS